jgi:TonB-linked SusC/RagA family outer membrane protein
MNKIFLLLGFFSLSFFSSAQTLKGTVLDNQQEPLPFANVYIPELGKGTSTQFDGSFEIVFPGPGTYRVEASFIGFRRNLQKITFEKPTDIISLTITLEEESEYLDEAIVTGYAVERRRDLTGTIVKIDAKEITDIPAPSFEAALQGKAAGVQVTQGSGLAGSSSIVRIRGIASISAGGDPLYVVDGIPITQDYFLKGNGGGMNNNPLATLNPNDIESVEILKDAAATGIYGSRGANGVIIITTKKAKTKGVEFDFSSRLGVSQPTALPQMVDAETYLQLYQEAWENDGNVGLAPLPGGISWADAINNNTDWVKETVTLGVKQAYSYSVKYRNDKLNTYSNISYDENESYLRGNSYTRISGRVNADYDFSENLRLTANTSFSQGINDRIDAAWSGGLGSAMSTALPIFPVMIDDSTYFQGGSNPTRSRELKQWYNVENRAIYSLSALYKVTDKLSIRGSGSRDLMKLTEDIYVPQALNPYFDHAGEANRYLTQVDNYNLNFLATYLTEDGRGNGISLLAGTEYQKSQNQYSSLRSIDATGPFSELASLDTTLTLSSPSSRYAFISYFGRAKYNVRDKYFFQGTMRMDGSSRFGANNLYGFFPSASAAWILSEEDFMKKFNSINFLKLKVSYGMTGNANIPNDQWRATFSDTTNSINYNGEPIIFPLRRENPDLQWESSNTLDFGIEGGLFEDKIHFTLEGYYKYTKDVLMDISLPPSSGFTSYWDNVGEILNKGVELSIKSHNIDREFKWTTNFNIAHNYNEIVSIGPYSEEAVAGGTNDTRVVVGMPVGTNFLVRFSHVDIDSGRPVYLDIDGNETFTWDPANRVAVGDVLPDAVGGLTNTFSYKNFDLSLALTFQIGGDIYDSSSKRQIGVVTDWNFHEYILDRWREPGDEATYPVLTMDPATYGASTPWINTDLWLHDGSYLRFRNLSFGYNVPQKALERRKIKNLRIALSATNFLTFTNYPGLDPEIARDFENNADRNMSANITFLTPPQEKTINLSFNMTF